MKLVNWNTNNDIFNMIDKFDNYFNNNIEHNYIKTKSNSIFNENDKSYFLILEMPGFDKSNIDLTINEDIINIAAQRKNIESLSNDKFINYQQSYYLPENVQIDKIKAKSKNGILSIEIPKLKKVKKDIKKIDII
ncbi:MAG: hypothetical protein CBB66_04295 [bacterium TMED6]|nr:MAG: hypothetical protein CBB66_04295 [bacterium TMED6]|tara:strand:- start:9453 stop:9857 length:405 start_codon:yes stop_codon:yes gene_type:complete